MTYLLLADPGSWWAPEGGHVQPPRTLITPSGSYDQEEHCAQLGEVEAGSWLEAKAAFGFSLTPLQTRLLARTKG